MEGFQYRRLPADCNGEEDWEVNLNDFLQPLLQEGYGESILIEVQRLSVSRFVFRRRHNQSFLILLWVFKSSCTDAPDLEDAVVDIEEWLLHGQGHWNVLCQQGVGHNDKSQGYFLGFQRVDKTMASIDLGSGHFDRFAFKSHARPRYFTERRCYSLVWTSTMILTLLMSITITLTAVFMAQPVPRKLELCPPIQTIHAKFTATSEQAVASKTSSTLVPVNTQGYIQFPTPPENKGPRRQEYLLPSNVSDFSMRHNISAEFTLRLDDQALIPTVLVDDYELKVQEWFATNFPILAAVRDSGNYLEPSYLDFDGEQKERILLHERYHIAHCTTAFRRYLRALQNQQHVCPRDLDFSHLDHCTGQLERFAYRPRDTWDLAELSINSHSDGGDRMMEKNEEFDPHGVQVMLLWHTDVCY